jgi:His/Glu/Gln/Arg/opine family amino acid ABC transporter permease subunit
MVMSDTYQYIFFALLDATYTTVGITVGAFIVAVVVGFLLALARLYGPAWLKYFVVGLVEALRNTPVLVQLFVIYFGLAQLGVLIPPMVAAVLGLGLNGAAMLSEVFRSSILAIDRGQTEAGLALGFTPMGVLRHVVLLQSLRISLPSISNFAVGLMKDTSLASAVAAPELAFRARTLVAETFLSTEIYLFVALIYFLLSFPVAAYFKALERAVYPVRSSHA